MGLDTKKRNKRQAKWVKEHRDRITITFPKESIKEITPPNVFIH